MASSDTGAIERSSRESGEGTPERVPLTHRVNVEPSVLRGMTVTEAKVIAAVSVPLFLLLGTVLTLLTGVWQLLLLLAVFGPLATLWFGSARLQDLKRGRPDGYYTQALHLWLARKGYAKCRFLIHQGQWDLGRSLPFSLSHSQRSEGNGWWSWFARSHSAATTPDTPKSTPTN
jgi:conjugative transfer region protein (TIGR03750 family)